MTSTLVLSDEVVDAARAERIGLVTEVVPHDQLLARSVESAGQIARARALDRDGLQERFAMISERNRRQI